MAETQPDVALGHWVYCKSHVGPHETGWCSVDVDNKIPLDLPPEASTKEAQELCWSMGLPIYGYCNRCHKFILNEDWYRRGEGRQRIDAETRIICPEHEDE